MSEDPSNTNDDMSPEEAAAELDALKAKADALEVKYHPSIKADKLREKIKARQAELEVENAQKAATQNTPINNPAAQAQAVAKDTAETKARKEALKLVRCRITCMDPLKKEYPGEIFCAGNSLVGTVKKYVPYETEWHVPQIILNMIQRRQYQTFVTVKTPGGGKTKKGKLVKAYAVEVLPPLTPAELKELKQRQLMARGEQD